MIEGSIDSNLEATIELDIQHDGAIHRQRFLVDTGFNGFFAVPERLVYKLGLKMLDVQAGITADGRASYFDTVELTVIWHDDARTVQAQILDEALVGTRILRGSRVQADWVRNGKFLIEQLRS